MIQNLNRELLLSILVLSIASVLLWGPVKNYINASQADLERMYTHLGTATIRLVDAESRRGIEIPKVYVLK